MYLSMKLPKFPDIGVPSWRIRGWPSSSRDDRKRKKVVRRSRSSRVEIHRFTEIQEACFSRFRFLLVCKASNFSLFLSILPSRDQADLLFIVRAWNFSHFPALVSFPFSSSFACPFVLIIVLRLFIFARLRSSLSNPVMIFHNILFRWFFSKVDDVWWMHLMNRIFCFFFYRRNIRCYSLWKGCRIQIDEFSSNVLLSRFLVADNKIVAEDVYMTFYNLWYLWNVIFQYDICVWRLRMLLQDG